MFKLIIGVIRLPQLQTKAYIRSRYPIIGGYRKPEVVVLKRPFYKMKNVCVYYQLVVYCVRLQLLFSHPYNIRQI